MKNFGGIKIILIAALTLMILAGTGAAVSLSNSGGGTWKYQREISIKENSGTTLTDYQVLIELKGADFPNEAKSDGADVRFTDSSGNELNYWIESWDYAGKNAKIWMKVPSISASTVTTVRMYYGNPSAGSSSNGDATFEFFDDFSEDLSKWSITGGSSSINSGKELEINTPQTGSWDTLGVLSVNTIQRPAIIDFDTRTPANGPNTITSSYGWMSSLSYYGSGGLAIMDNWNSPYHAWLCPGDASCNGDFGVYPLDYKHTTIVLPVSSGYKIIYNKNIILSNSTWVGSSESTNKLEFQASRFNQAGGYSFYVDNVRVRKYSSSESTITFASPKSSSLSITKSASPYSLRQFQESTIKVLIENSGTSEVKAIEIMDSIHPSFDLTGGDFPNPKKFDSIRAGESRELQYTIKSKESGAFTLGPATVTYSDSEGNIQEVKSESASIKVVPSPIPPTQTRSPECPTSSAVLLHGEKTDVVLGEDILLKLSAVNLITKPPMSVQVMIYPPSGMSVTSSEFIQSGAGIYTTKYILNPGDGKDIEVNIKSNQAGDFNVKGRIVYYFGDDINKAEDCTLNLPIKVVTPKTTPTPTGPTKTDMPGFVGGIAIIGILFMAIYIRKRF